MRINSEKAEGKNTLKTHQGGSMNSKSTVRALALFVALAAAATTTLSHAATPVAVWDGDFTATQTGFTLNRSGNAISADNSTITIDQDVGVKVDFTTGFSTAMTVMFKYSDLAFDAQKTLATSFCSGGDENRTGVYAASGGTINGIWNTADWGNASQTLSKSSGVLAFCYHKSNGTSLYYISADGTRAELFNKSGLKASGDTAINGCTIGGERAKTGATLLSAATGMKITGIAIFEGTLTEGEMTHYIWPNDVVEYTLTLDGTATSWSAGEWKAGEASVDAPTAGFATINLTASTTLTIDEAVGLNNFTVNAAPNAVLTLVNGEGGSFAAYGKISIESGVLQQGSAGVLGDTAVFEVASGATLDLNGFSLNNAATSVYIAGAGAGDWPWALTSSGGAFSGTIQNLYLTGNATIGGPNQIVLGRDWAGSNGYLGGYTLTKTGSGELYVKNFNTPQVGAIVVSEGTLTTAQWNCLNRADGDTTLTIANGATVRAANQEANPPAVTVLNWDGTLNTASRHFIVKNTLNGGGTTAYLNFDANATANLKSDLTVTSTLTLSGAMSFLKHNDAESDVVVTASGSLSSSGAISVGAGVTLNLGVNRPTGEITVANGGTLAVQLQNAAETISLSVSSQPSSLVLYGTDGNVISNPRISYSDGTLTIKPPVPTLNASGATAFDTAANWIDSTMPDAYGDAIIELSGDAEIQLSGDYVFGNIYISGNATVAFTSTSESSFATANIYLQNGARLLKTASPAVTATEINLDSGTVLKLSGIITESATISGAGAVETYGKVVLATASRFTGGITVKSGSTLSTSAEPIWDNPSTKTECATGYGLYNKDWAYSALSCVTVESGGCVDINNVANLDAGIALVIAGNGVLQDGVYSGAVTYSGESAIGNNKRQASSLSLSANALVDIGAGWGLVHSAHENARLGLNGYTLTVRGPGTFPAVNVNNQSATTGTLILEGATLELSTRASNLSGVNIVARGCATINLATAPSALGSLTIEPTASGTTASAWNLPTDFVPVVSLLNINTSGLSDGEVLTPFTAPQATLSTDNISIKDRTSTRFTTEISGNTVVATFHAGSLPANFMHYDFNVDASAAADSTTSFSTSGEGSDVSLVSSRNGKAIKVHTGFTPYWNSVGNSVSPLHDNKVSVTAVVKLRETNIVLWGLGAAANNRAFGLVATDAHTVAVVAKRGSSEVETLATLTNTRDLTSGWHFIAVVADENGTTLYVDDQSVSSAIGAPTGIGQQGQLGSFHGGAFGASKVGANGYRLDDWRVYDNILTAEEITAIRTALLPYATMFLLR